MPLRLYPLDIFNGTLTDSSRTSPDGFRYIYATLYSAFVYGSQLPTIQDLNSRVATAETNAGPGTIPLMAQRIDYATVRADAFSTNLLAYQNGQVVDVAGRAQNPYQMRTAFAVAPTRTYSATGNVSLIMPSAIYTQRRFYGGPPYPTGKYLDFGDGRGYLPVTWDQAIAANYSTAGTKRVKVRFVYFVYYDGTSYESQFDLEARTR